MADEQMDLEQALGLVLSGEEGYMNQAVSVIQVIGDLEE